MDSENSPTPATCLRSSALKRRLRRLIPVALIFILAMLVCWKWLFWEPSLHLRGRFAVDPGNPCSRWVSTLGFLLHEPTRGGGFAWVLHDWSGQKIRQSTLENPLDLLGKGALYYSPFRSMYSSMPLPFEIPRDGEMRSTNGLQLTQTQDGRYVLAGYSSIRNFNDLLSILSTRFPLLKINSTTFTLDLYEQPGILRGHIAYPIDSSDFDSPDYLQLSPDGRAQLVTVRGYTYLFSR